MRAAGFRQNGPPEVLSIMELDDPVPSEDEAIVRVPYSSVNRLDLLVRQGYRELSIPLPHVPGADIVGKIESLGSGVREFVVGDAVISNNMYGCGRCANCIAGRTTLCPKWICYGLQAWGSYGELVKVKASSLIRQPGGYSEQELTAMPLALGVGWRALNTVAKAQGGETILIRGASGNVGIFLTMVSREMGLNVIALSRDKKKQGMLKNIGATNVLDPSSDTVKKEISDLTEGNGPDIIIDSFGGTLNESVEIVRRGGRIVVFGSITGVKSEINTKLLYLKCASIAGTTNSTRGELAEALAFVSKHNIRPVIADTLPIENAPEAHGRLERSENFGKIILKHG